MAFPAIRKFLYQNPTSTKLYEVVLKRNSNGTVNGIGYLLGTNKINSDPVFDNAETTFVIITGAETDPFNFNLHDTYLAQAPIYNASNPAGAGVALSTLLV